MTYDAERHHIGLGADTDSLEGYELVGPYLKQLAAPVFDRPSDIGTDDLTGQRSLSTWTQNDYSGGEFQEDWADKAMFSECLGMLPNQLSTAIRTTRPLKQVRDGDWGAGTDLIRMDSLDGYIYVCVNSSDDGVPHVARLSPSSPSGAGLEVEPADICSADSIITAAYWNSTSERLWLGSSLADLGVHKWDQTQSAGSRLVITATLDAPGLDLAEPTVQINGIHIFGDLRFVVTGHGDGTQDDNRVWLYVSGTGSDTKWTQVGILPGSFVKSVTYNNAVYFLTRKGDSSTQLSMSQGDQVFPVLDLPYFFQGQSMVEYAGRLYIGGIGRDLEGDVHHGELFEVNGTSLRLVRTFAQQYEIPTPAADPFDGPRKRTMRHFKALAVAEGLLWMPDSSFTGLEVYDATTDAFYGGPRLRTGDDPDLEFTHILPFGDSLYLWAETSTEATNGFYRTERRADGDGTYTSYLTTSDFHPEPGRLKVWSRLATLSRYAAPTLQYSLDSGGSWHAVTIEATVTQGTRYERSWSLADVPQSQAIRFRFSFAMTGDSEENAGELVTHSLSFLVRGDGKRRWQFTINGALAPEALDEEAAEQVPTTLYEQLWALRDAESTIAFRDVDGTDYSVVVTDIQQQSAFISADLEGHVALTLLEI